MKYLNIFDKYPELRDLFPSRGIVTKQHLPDEYGVSFITCTRREEDDPLFPRRIQLTTKRVGYLRNELDAYFHSRRVGETPAMDLNVPRKVKQL